MQPRKILLDTSTIINLGFEGIKKFSKKYPDRNIFITNIVLRELDGLKNAEGETGYTAREFFRQLENIDTKKDTSVLKTKNKDAIFKYDSDEINLHVIIRENYRHKDINDTLIIEIAKDYNLELFTIDSAMKVRAKSEGVEVVKVKYVKPTGGRRVTTAFWVILVVMFGFGHWLVESANPSVGDIKYAAYFFAFIASFFLTFIYAALIGEAKPINYDNRNSIDDISYAPEMKGIPGNIW